MNIKRSEEKFVPGDGVDLMFHFSCMEYLKPDNIFKKLRIITIYISLCLSLHFNFAIIIIMAKGPKL